MSVVSPSANNVAAPAPAAAGDNVPGVTSQVDDEMKKNGESKDGAHVHAVPKPVEMTSVPETPVNGGTPVGGTPRPELNIEEPKEKTPPPEEANVILGPGAPTAAPAEPSATEPVSEAKMPNGSGAAPETGNGVSAGEKRKAGDGETKFEPAPNGGEAGTAAAATAAPTQQDEQRPDKKAKITDKIADTVSGVKDKIESKVEDAGKGKPGRPKKDKTVPPPVGRTERKTRSQGPAEQPQ